MGNQNPFVQRATEIAAAAFASQRANDEAEADAFAQYIETLDSAVDHCHRILNDAHARDGMPYIDALVTIAEQRARAYGVLPDIECGYCCD